MHPILVHPLLIQLDGLVKKQDGPSGLHGSVCFGVRSAGGCHWWWARFDGSDASTEFLDDMPDGVDVAVGLDADHANALLTEETFAIDPNGLALVAGDERLLGRFIKRYVAQQSMVALRAWRNSSWQ